MTMVISQEAITQIGRRERQEETGEGERGGKRGREKRGEREKSGKKLTIS